MTGSCCTASPSGPRRGTEVALNTPLGRLAAARFAPARLSGWRLSTADRLPDPGCHEGLRGNLDTDLTGGRPGLSYEDGPAVHLHRGCHDRCAGPHRLPAPRQAVPPRLRQD